MAADGSRQVSGAYLFACHNGDSHRSSGTVFFHLDDESLTSSLLALLEKEYGGGEGNPTFNAQAMADTTVADQILLDEALDWLAIYDDPDHGVYDPPPSRETMLRALYAQRTECWAEMLRSRKAGTSTSKNDPPSLAQMRRLHQCLVKIDNGIMSFGSRLAGLRKADPHGLISEPTRAGALIGQIKEIQDQLEKWTSPVLETAREAQEICAGISTHVGAFVDDPIKWETDLRESLRRLRDALAALPHSYGAQIDEAQLISIGATLYAQGTRLEDGIATLDARETVSATDDGRPDVANGWKFELLEEGEVRASNQKLCSDYAAMDEHDLLAISARWRQMANRFTEATKRTGHYNGHIVHDDEVLQVTKILETAVAQRHFPGVNTLGRCLRRPDDGHLHWALATLDELDAKLRAEASTRKTTNPEGKGSDQGPVRQLAAALQELRLATGELLHRSGKVDLYPEPEINTFHQALRDAESHVDGISSHLAYGRQSPGQIETDIREILHKLSREMEQVTSDYNDRPGAYPLPKEMTAPGWEVLKGLMPLEMVLTMTTMKPGDSEMPVEDRRVSGLILLMLLAQAYYKMLECVISMASWCSVLDVELNQSYLWVTSSLKNLLKNHEDLKDFPVEFKPIFDDLYPSTVRDIDWDDMVAPEAERFLSTVQKYVHQNNVYEPREGSPAWTFVQLFKPSVETAMSRAMEYHKRMHQHAHKAFGGMSAGKKAASKDARAEAPTAPSASVEPSRSTVATDLHLPEQIKYELAKQAELLRATNQVLGQGALNKGVLSRACSERLIETNGKFGQSSRVKVRSFLVWVGRKLSVSHDELTQIRNAIIGEINERNTVD